MERKVKATFSVECNGPEGILLQDGKHPVGASVTIYDDGSREVGCGYLGFNRMSNGDNCSAVIDTPCPHLLPQKYWKVFGH